MTHPAWPIRYQIAAIMLWPADPARRIDAMKRVCAKDFLAHPEPYEDQRTGLMSEVKRARVKGTAMGLALRWLLRQHRERARISLAQFKREMESSLFFTEHKLRGRTFEADRETCGPVAPLWAAHLHVLEENDGDAYPFTVTDRAEDFRQFLRFAECYRVEGATLVLQGSQGPFIDPETCWRPSHWISQSLGMNDP